MRGPELGGRCNFPSTFLRRSCRSEGGNFKWRSRRNWNLTVAPFSRVLDGGEELFIYSQGCPSFHRGTLPRPSFTFRGVGRSSLLSQRKVKKLPSRFFTPATSWERSRWLQEPAFERRRLPPLPAAPRSGSRKRNCFEWCTRNVLSPICSSRFCWPAVCAPR